MRALSLVALLLVSAPAGAAPIRVWQGYARDVDHTAYRDFTISTSPTAYLTLTSALHDFTAGDGASVASLFADMINGVNNPLTFSTSTFSYTADEDFAFTDTATPEPLVGYSGYLYPPKIDLASWTIDRVTVGRAQPEGIRRYYFEVWAHVPEPSSALLLLSMCCALAHLRMGPRRRSSVS